MLDFEERGKLEFPEKTSPTVDIDLTKHDHVLFYFSYTFVCSQ